jgi:hypothetical protein
MSYVRSGYKKINFIFYWGRMGLSGAAKRKRQREDAKMRKSQEGALLRFLTSNVPNSNNNPEELEDTDNDHDQILMLENGTTNENLSTENGDTTAADQYGE